MPNLNTTLNSNLASSIKSISESAWPLFKRQIHVFPMSFQGHSWRLKALEFQYSHNLASGISDSFLDQTGNILWFLLFCQTIHYKYKTSTDPNINFKLLCSYLVCFQHQPFASFGSTWKPKASTNSLSQ